jgi:2-oxoglutarate ferredoxin oxidoreductase subunit beta
MKADMVHTDTLKAVYTHPKSLKKVKMHYCPGCGHGIIHKVLAQCIDELGIREESIIVAPVGCSVLIYNYYNCDGAESPHGRAQAVSTGLKRALPERTIICYQGDGDLAAIGTAESLHAANRGENFTVVFVNNAIYGMTGGQMAPTTLVGQRTKTSPFGRDAANEGAPLKWCEILTEMDGPAYVERVSVHDVKHVLKARKAIKKGIEYQRQGLGYSFIEVLSMCPTNWGMSSTQAAHWIEENMIPYFPLKLFRDRGKGGASGK